MTFKQQVDNILSSTKNMQDADYRRLVFGESLYRSNNRSLIDYMKQPISWDSYSDRKKITEAVNCIADAMNSYLISSTAPNTYKQRIYKIFCDWLDNICEKYSLRDDYKCYMSEPVKSDMGIAFIKAFHREKPITKKELTDELKIDSRSVQSWLRKIDPSLSEDGGGAIGEYRIAGHHITADIEVKETDKYGKKFYQMPSTVHPLVLQLNVMQLGVLLKSICVSYNEVSFVGYDIALDIWAQLSDYARNRIRFVFAQNDSDFAEFLEELTDELERFDTIRTFKTEKELMEDGGNSILDQIMLAFKTGTACNVRLRDENGKANVYRNRRIISVDANSDFVAIPVGKMDALSDAISFSEEDVLDIEYIW